MASTQPWNVKIPVPDPDFTWEMVQREFRHVRTVEWFYRTWMLFIRDFSDVRIVGLGTIRIEERRLEAGVVLP